MKGCTRELVVLLACASCVAVAWWGLAAWTPLPAASGLVDLRTDKDHQDYAIVVNVRDAGAYGHARVSWFAYGGETRTTLSFGYYADHLGKVVEAFDTSGVVENELDEELNALQITTLALVLWVERDQYEETRTRLERWKGTGRYALFNRDCVTFVADVLEPLGLTIPVRLFAPRPYDFLTALMEVNVKRPDL